MKNRNHILISMVFVVALVMFPEHLLAQGYGPPLTIQGTGKSTMHSAAQRGLGGGTIGVTNDLGVMFHNPAALYSLQGPSVSVGGLGQTNRTEQTQHYAPVKYYSNLSLLLEGLTGSIPDPDTLLGGATPADTVQRPYDALGPNWSSSKDRARPLQVFAGVPFQFAGLNFVGAAGAVEYADLNSSYQNNNVLNPSILSERPLPTPRPPNNANPIFVNWSQHVTSREGFVQGYGAALSADFPEYNVSLGVSGMLLTGSSDDFERTVSRGRLTFFTNSFRLDSVYSSSTRTGTSEYSGQELTASGIYHSGSVSFGITVKAPTRIRRTYSGQVQTVNSSGVSVQSESEKDWIKLPWRGTAGLSISPKENFLVAIEYELRPYSSAVYKAPSGVRSNPWLSASLLRVGVRYDALPWLTVRGGIRGQAEAFEPEGNPIAGEAVSYSIYSVGVGIEQFGFRLDLTYEYSLMKYQDVWGSAISLNSTTTQVIVAGLTYELPKMW